MGQGRGKAPTSSDPRTAVPRSRRQGTCLLRAFLLSCCVTVSSAPPLSGPASLQERPSCAQEIPARGFCRQETLQPPATRLSREGP